MAGQAGVVAATTQRAVHFQRARSIDGVQGSTCEMLTLFCFLLPVGPALWVAGSRGGWGVVCGDGRRLHGLTHTHAGVAANKRPLAMHLLGGHDMTGWPGCKCLWALACADVAGLFA